MQAYKEFEQQFQITNIREAYFKNIRHRASVGIDRLNRITFERDIDKYILDIFRKSRNLSYRYSSYKEKLISKGREKCPRIISIPTIRDKITLRLLTNILNNVYENNITNSVHSIINDVQQTLILNNYDYFFRLDIKDFYPSIDHELLLKRIKKNIRKKEVLSLILSSIKTPTISLLEDYKGDEIEKGVPQGLPISNILSEIYLMDFDQIIQSSSHYKYFRYVDDILILCNQNDSNEISELIKSNLDKNKLCLQVQKTKENYFISGFDYLGYFFKPNFTSIREKSKRILRLSIIKTISQYKYSKIRDLKILEWNLNLRITGCIFDNKKYGWLFFFSQINDLQYLYTLDWFVRKILDNHNISKNRINIKKFIRTYHEIRKNLTNTSYIPNFSNYSNEKKKDILKEIFNFKIEKIESLEEEEIEHLFKKCIYRSIKDLERDLHLMS